MYENDPFRIKPFSLALHALSFRCCQVSHALLSSLSISKALCEHVVDWPATTLLLLASLFDTFIGFTFTRSYQRAAQHLHHGDGLSSSEFLLATPNMKSLLAQIALTHMLSSNATSSRALYTVFCSISKFTTKCDRRHEVKLIASTCVLIHACVYVSSINSM